ncbi:hypothetical protein ES692_10540 [Psychroserpens burtonensis]|uniref:LURP-one-related family protein n=1 Tax=Psychroserpens burtonensis TaxID=49278 RepID=A0A5C7B7R3_9FLAO|nr:hypothetical protein [Psychroserpens burtonensis]TXE17089.1 hypothetical protein ES692_10540 [Psychroserpens burtonensis]
MKDLNFPISFTFHVTTLSNDFSAKDANGRTVAYVRQKMFKLKEDINIYDNENRTRLTHNIRADKWIDFSAAYSFKDAQGKEIGKIARKGWASVWKAHYELIDQHQKLQYHIREDNAWVKVLDSVLGQLPIIGGLTGYLFNPSYTVTDLNDQAICQLKKEASFFGRKFKLSKLKPIDHEDDERIVLGFMMMVLLERRRG